MVFKGHAACGLLDLSSSRSAGVSSRILHAWFRGKGVRAACEVCLWFGWRGCLRLCLQEFGSLDSLWLFGPKHRGLAEKPGFSLHGHGFPIGHRSRKFSTMVDRELLGRISHIQACTWGRFNPLHRTPLGRCILDNLDSDRRASSRFMRRSHTGRGPEILVVTIEERLEADAPNAAASFHVV